jgi:hypothetical protein
MKDDGRKLRAMERKRRMIAKAEAERRAIKRLTTEFGMTTLQAVGALETFKRKRRASK